MSVGAKVVIIVEDGPRAVFKGLTGTIIKDEGWGSWEVRFENPGRQCSFPEGELAIPLSIIKSLQLKQLDSP